MFKTKQWRQLRLNCVESFEEYIRYTEHSASSFSSLTLFIFADFYFRICRIKVLSQ